MAYILISIAFIVYIIYIRTGQDSPIFSRESIEYIIGNNDEELVNLIYEAVPTYMQLAITFYYILCITYVYNDIATNQPR
jgi:hypothetical protein